MASYASISSKLTGLNVLLSVIVVVSLARYSVDGFALEMMGRSLSQGGDFQQYYVAGTMLRGGEDIYDLERATEVTEETPYLKARAAGYLYPPVLAIAMVPISLLPFPLAYRLWVLGEQGCLLLSLYVLARNLPALGRLSWPVLIILAANAYPLYQSIDVGQINLVILVMLCLVIHFARRGFWFWAGPLSGLPG